MYILQLHHTGIITTELLIVTLCVGLSQLRDGFPRLTFLRIHVKGVKFPPVPPSTLQLVETLSSLVPDDVSATGHFASPRSHSVEQLAFIHSNCFFCHNFQESTQDSFIYPVILHNIISSVRCCTVPW